MIFKQIYLTHISDCNKYLLRVRVYQGVMAIRSELELHHQMQFSVTPRNPLFYADLTFLQVTLSVFSKSLLMRNPVLHFYDIYKICFGLVLWHVNHCRLFNAKSCFTYILYIYIRFVLDWFYGMSTIADYLMPNPVLHIYYIYIYKICFLLVLWHVNHCRLFNAKSCFTYILYIYIYI